MHPINTLLHPLYSTIKNYIKPPSEQVFMLPKLVIFDMDGTIVQYPSGNFQSSWDAIGFATGKKDEWERLMAYYLPRRERYDEWSGENCRLLAGLPVQPVFDQIFPPPYTPGFKEFCTYLDQRKIKKGIISSGVDLVAERIQQETALDFIVANEVHVRDGKFTGGGKINVGISGKGKSVREIIQRYRVSQTETAFFGDHFNDREAWQEVGLPFGMNVKDSGGHAFVRRNFTDFYQAKEFFADELEGK